MIQNTVECRDKVAILTLTEANPTMSATTSDSMWKESATRAMELVM